MTTGQYISWLSKRIAGNLFSRQDLVDAVNQAQNEILGRDILFMRVRPDLFFHTTTAVYSYAASTYLFNSIDGTTQYDIRNVSRIYTFNIRSSPIFEYGGINRVTNNPETFQTLPGSTEVTLPADVTQSIAPLSADCTIKLWRENNPGTQTIIYLAEAYKWPTQVTSEAIALSIPEQFQRGLLKYAVLRELEQTEYGKAGENEDLYQQELKRFDNWASRGAKIDPTSTPPRDC